MAGPRPVGEALGPDGAPRIDARRRVTPRTGRGRRDGSGYVSVWRRGLVVGTRRGDRGGPGGSPPAMGATGIPGLHWVLVLTLGASRAHCRPPGDAAPVDSIRLIDSLRGPDGVFSGPLQKPLDAVAGSLRIITVRLRAHGYALARRGEGAVSAPQPHRSSRRDAMGSRWAGAGGTAVSAATASVGLSLVAR